MRQAPTSAANLVRTLTSGSAPRLLLRWYLSPSGIVYGLALAMLLAALIQGDSSLVLAVPAIALLAVFMPYKLWRERTITTNLAESMVAEQQKQLHQMEQRQLRHIEQRQQRQQRRLRQIEQRLEATGRDVKTTAAATASALRSHSEALVRLDGTERRNGEL